MKRVLMLVALISLAPAQRAMAEPPERGKREDAPRLLGEALRSGSADAESIAAIVRWVLEEKEENVASGLAAALSAAVGDVPDGAVDPRWSAAARGAIALFEGLLDDARGYRRRDEASVARDLAPIIEAAAPAVADALREVDAPTREAVRRAWELFAPAAPCAPPR